MQVILLLLLISVIVLVSAITLSRIVTYYYARARVFDVQSAPNKPAAIVFGAGLRRDGTPTSVLRDRVSTAVELYRSGKISKILMSGDNRFEYYNEPGAMKEFALDLGLPEEAIALDYAGRRTYDTCYRAREIFGLQRSYPGHPKISPPSGNIHLQFPGSICCRSRRGREFLPQESTGILEFTRNPSNDSRVLAYIHQQTNASSWQPGTHLSIGGPMNREEGYQIVQEYVKNENLIRHMLSVEACMRFYAEKFEEDVEMWGLTGLLHDFDWEIHPTLEQHPQAGAPILREWNVPEEVIRAIQSHADHTGISRETGMEKALYACDEITGLIVAVALVRPSRSLYDLNVKSVKKKWKDKAFAAGANREEIESAAEEFGIPLWEHTANVISAMREAAPQLGLEGNLAEDQQSTNH